MSPLIVPARNPLNRLFQYLQPYRLLLYRSVFYSFVNKLLDLAPPVLVGWAVDTVARNPPDVVTFFAGDSVVSSAILLGVLGVVIFGVESLFQWLYTLGFMSLAQFVQHDLRLDGYRKMQNREMRFFENHRMGETMSMLSDDINQLERFLNTVFNDIIQIIALFLIAGFILLNASVGLSIIAILPIPLVVWGSLVFQKMLTPRYQKVRQAVGQVNTRLENNIGGIGVIKSFGAEKFESQRLSEVSRVYLDTNISAIRLSALFTPLIRMGVALGFGATLTFGAIWTLEGHITPGVFTLFAMMCQRILWPLTKLGEILNETERCRASAARIFGLIDTPPGITDAPDAKDLGRVQGKISFQQVHFRYEQGNEILKGLDFTITPGETIGVAGATGAGKSTLIKLLLRFYDPTSGTVALDDTALTEATTASIRRNIALVSQEVYLFHGTIAENISYGAQAATQESIAAAAKQAQLHEFIESLPEGYSTIVGERGIKLSGGQRQRLSIARALLKNAPIIVLDEATSSVDTETERAIQAHLEAFTKGRTALIIAHRLSTIRNADRILVLGDGKLVEAGTHEELLANEGAYADLWRLQSGEIAAPVP